MSADLPLVSVVVPSFNRLGYLRETLKSIGYQDYPRIETLVVDGGSIDGTVEFLREWMEQDYAPIFPRSFLSEPDNGPQEAINKGWRMAHGSILTWLNSDDLWEAGAVRKAVKCFLDNPKADVVYGDYVVIDEHGKRISGHTKVREWNLLSAVEQCDHIIAQSASFMRRPLLENVGFLYPKLCHDHELWLRLALAGANFQKCNEVLGLPRRHAGNLGASCELVIPLKLEITKNFFSLPGVTAEMQSIKERAMSNAYLRCVDYVKMDRLTDEQKTVKIKWLIEEAKRADPSNTQRIERSSRVLPELNPKASRWKPSKIVARPSGPLLIVPTNPGYEMIANNAPEAWTRVRWPMTAYQKGFDFAVIFCEQKHVKDLDRKYLEKQLKCRVIPVLFDAVRQPDNLVEMMGGPPVVTMDVPKPGAVWLQTPIDERLYQPNAPKTIECLFLGRIKYYSDRRDWAKLLKNVTFIERDDSRPYMEYAKILSSAKTIVNFCRDRTNGKPAMKGRVFEALMAGAVLLEQENERTSYFLKPGQDYLEWKTPAEITEHLQTLREDPNYAAWILKHAADEAECFGRMNAWNQIARLAQ